MTNQVKEALQFLLIIPALLIAFGAGIVLVIYFIAWLAWAAWMGA